MFVFFFCLFYSSSRSLLRAFRFGLLEMRHAFALFRILQENTIFWVSLRGQVRVNKDLFTARCVSRDGVKKKEEEGVAKSVQGDKMQR